MGTKQKFEAREVSVCQFPTALYRTREVGSTSDLQSFHERKLCNSIHDATGAKLMSWENARLCSARSCGHRALQRLGVSQMWGGFGHRVLNGIPWFWKTLFFHCWLSVVLSSLVSSGGSFVVCISRNAAEFCVWMWGFLEIFLRNFKSQKISKIK